MHLTEIILVSSTTLFIYHFNQVKDAYTMLYNRQQGDTYMKHYNTIKSLGSIIYSKYYLQMYQYLNTSVRKVASNTWEVDYVIKNKKYTIIVEHSKPSSIFYIENHAEEDITDDILPYLGPHEDWHGKEVCPSYFGHESIKIHLKNGSAHVLHSKSSDEDEDEVYETVHD